MPLMHKLQIELYINDRLIRQTISPETTALTFIREHVGLTAIKEMCAEGDCGACTIALGELKGDIVNYKAINSCILPAARLHGKHVITIEGLAAGKALHLLQTKMLEHHAVQCGYCTSGMLMSLFCLFANNQFPTRQDITIALEGNLCRCTGYDAIQKAAADFSNVLKSKENLFTWFYPIYCQAMPNNLAAIGPMQYTAIPSDTLDIWKEYRLPNNLTDLFHYVDELKGNFKILNGGTDLMVAANIHGKIPKKIIDISNIADLDFILEDNNKIGIGAATTLHHIAASPIVNAKLPVLAQTIATMGSTQVRNIATLAGNIANASPIADAACLLLALDAELTLLRRSSERKVKLENFYHDYKVTALNSDLEIISAIEIPVTNAVCKFIKSSKRKAVDIATVNSAIRLLQNPDGSINNCRIACGGVAKLPALALKASAFLAGKTLSDAVINEAADIAVSEFVPLSDVRGSADYRSLLIRNHVVKLLNEFVK